MDELTYFRDGNVMKIDHWFGKVRGIDGGGFMRPVDKPTKVIKNKIRALKPVFWQPIIKLENRKAERLVMDKRIECMLVWCPNTKIPEGMEYPYQVEKLARKKPTRDWRIEIIEAFESAVYQRQGRNKWVLIELGKGYA